MFPNCVPTELLEESQRKFEPSMLGFTFAAEQFWIPFKGFYLLLQRREKRIEKTETRNALALQYETDERRRLGICGALPSLWTAALEASCAAPTECERTPHSCVPRVPSEKKKRERGRRALLFAKRKRGTFTRYFCVCFAALQAHCLH